jgi:hypothetical protein
MPDFPTPNVPDSCTPLFINTSCDWFAGSIMRAADTITAPVSTTWVANLAIYQMFTLPWPYTVARFCWVNGATLTGPPNIDLGIFAPDGTKLVSTGNTAQSGTNTVQFAAASTVTRLAAGTYFFGISSSGSTALIYCYAGLSVGPMAAAQMFQQATANPLPATATFARPTNALMPYGGFTRTASGF